MSSLEETPDRPIRQRLFFPDQQNDDTTVQESPVPLSREEAANAEVRALAAKLTPALVEADAFLASHGLADNDDRSNDNLTREDDDGILEEEEDLLKSEDMLRHELEMAQDFGRFFQTTSSQPATTRRDPQTFPVKEESPPVQAEADMEQMEDPEVAKTNLPPIPLPATPSRTPSNVGSPATSFCWSSPSGIRYTPQDHMEALHLQREHGSFYYSVDLTRYLVQNNSPDGGIVKDYCLAIPEPKLKRLCVGLLEHHPTNKSNTGANTKLPVRTLTIRLRGDVLCGSITEAIHHALAPSMDGVSLQATIRKRQGGHIRAWIPSAVVNTRSAAEEQHWAVTAALQEDGTMEQPDATAGQVYPAFAADLQVVTLKDEGKTTPSCERCLLIRIYHPTSDDTSTVNGDGTSDQTIDSDHDEQVVGSPVTANQETRIAEAIPTDPNRALREAASLVQFMESPESVRRKVLKSFQSNNVRNIPAMRETVQEHLLEHYLACPSVKNGGITLPALNNEDYSIVQSSWRLVQAVWDELDTRGLAYSTLRETRFGAFPALPTLDGHYVSQLRRLSRDFMVVQLLKSATQLEEYAREAEYACANMISLLKPTFESYGIAEPSLPKPVALTSYPLDFTAPQTSCPPFGQQVQTALNEVQSWVTSVESPAATVILEDTEAMKSFALSEKSVQCVFAAFQRQDDEEQNARLGRKNVQVMDRLAKMQAHQQKSIQLLETATHSEQASKAAEDFCARTGGIKEVPLLKWKILVGGATGTCTITAHHIMFVTQLIPVIGGNKVTLFDLSEVDFRLREETPSLLNPLSTVITVRKDGEEVYSFRPSMGGSRLKMFLGLLQKTTLEDPLFVPSPR